MATSHKYEQTSTKWTFGAELELVDWPRNDPLPEGMAVDDGNYTSVNSNGVAVDGKGKSYHLGGEILTAPSEEITGPADQFNEIKHRWPQACHNYRTGLNVHVRIPGLRDDLQWLKQIQMFTHRLMPTLLPIIDPIPDPPPDSKGGARNFRTRKKDHYTLLSKERLELQMKARTPKEFFEAEVVDTKTGIMHWSIRPRTCVNLRQILQTDTIEFRHFFMPDDARQLYNTTIWCNRFLEAALGQGYGQDVTAEAFLREVKFEKRTWPKGLPYDPWLDEGFYYTSPQFNDRADVPRRIEEWLEKNKNRKA